MWSISSEDASNKTSTVLRPRGACACHKTWREPIQRLFSRSQDRSTTNSRPMALSLLSATCLPYHLSTILRYDTSSSYFERFHFHRLPRSVLAPINFPELWSRIFDQLISTLCQSSKKIYFLLHISIPLPFEDTERSLILSALSACCMPMMIIVTQR